MTNIVSKTVISKSATFIFYLGTGIFILAVTALMIWFPLAILSFIDHEPPPLGVVSFIFLGAILMLLGPVIPFLSRGPMSDYSASQRGGMNNIIAKIAIYFCILGAAIALLDVAAFFVWIWLGLLNTIPFREPPIVFMFVLALGCLLFILGAAIPALWFGPPMERFRKGRRTG
jgi:hypothetical protein